MTRRRAAYKGKMRMDRECGRIYFRMDRREIGFLRFIMEAHDNLAMLRTIDAREGRMVLHAPSGCETDVRAILADLGRDIRIQYETDVHSDHWLPDERI